MKYCGGCDTTKNETEFHKDSLTRYGLQSRSRCKECDAAAAKARAKTLEGALEMLAHHAQQRAKSGRVERCEIDKNDLRQIYDTQRGLCFYSGLPMNHDKRGWKISLERLDQAGNYVLENIALIVLELNNWQQWTLEKVKLVVLNYLSGDTTPIFADFSLPTERKKVNKSVKEIRNGEIFYRCTKFCNDFHPASNFTKQVRDGCEECRKRINEEGLNTPRGHFMKLLNNARRHTQKRNANPKRTPTVCELTLEDLVAKFNAQGGRCAISRMPLKFGPKKDWAASLERRDVNIGYTPANTSLIANLFQATDPSSIMNDDPDDNTSYGWTREKFLVFVESARKKLGL